MRLAEVSLLAPHLPVILHPFIMLGGDTGRQGTRQEASHSYRQLVGAVILANFLINPFWVFTFYKKNSGTLGQRLPL